MAEYDYTKCPECGSPVLVAYNIVRRFRITQMDKNCSYTVDEKQIGPGVKSLAFFECENCAKQWNSPDELCEEHENALWNKVGDSVCENLQECIRIEFSEMLKEMSVCGEESENIRSVAETLKRVEAKCPDCTKEEKTIGN